MITVVLNGERVTIRPRSLHSYIEKTDYIKSRRPSPYSSLRDLPKQKNREATDRYVEIAIMASMKLSSVSFEEEMRFDISLEGYYYAAWQGTREHFKWDSDSTKGVDQVEKWISKLDPESQESLRLALRGIDERALAKNSDGPEKNPQKGPEEESSPAGEKAQSETPTAT